MGFSCLLNWRMDSLFISNGNIFWEHRLSVCRKRGAVQNLLNFASRRALRMQTQMAMIMQADTPV
jgi:hypothetical protein